VQPGQGYAAKAGEWRGKSPRRLAAASWKS